MAPVSASTCDLCHGTGFRPSTWVDPRLIAANLPSRPAVEPCVCALAREQQQRIGRAGIPPEYRGCTFANYRAYTDTLTDVLDLARAFADRFPERSPQRTDPTGLLLIGQAGVGKTHLAAAILRAVIDRTHLEGRFYKTRELLRAMRDSYNPAIQTTERQILEPVLTCDLLVLDDLGAERLTDWVADTMDLIIDTRYSAGLPLIVTTNYADVDDSTEINGLWWRVGFRSRSRLHQMCRFLTLDGTDYRDVSPESSDKDLRRLARQRGTVSPSRALQSRGPQPTAKDGKADLGWPGGRGGNS